MSERMLMVALLVVLTFVWGCKPAQTDPPKPPPPPPAPAGASIGDMPERTTRFAFDLFSKLQGEQPDENLFVSPLSVAMALSSVYHGAGADTASAIAKTMGWDGLNAGQVGTALKGLAAQLQAADPEVKLTIADSLWAREDVTFKPTFLEAVKATPDVRVEALNFGDPASAGIINNWVKDKTAGLIPEITTPQDLAGLWLMVLDAVYFKGRWSDVFSKDATQDAPFTLLDGSQRTVPMMAQTGEFAYQAGDLFQAIRLPYGRDHRLAMVVFLPAKQVGLKGFLAALSAEKWAQWTGAMAVREGTIKLPRFTAKNDRKLNAALTALGMGVAFDQAKADFSALCDRKMWIDLVRQKSYLKVDEEGTEAAAVTQVGMVGAAAPPPGEPFEMVVDRPFFLAITDRDTQTILFMGAIVAPEE
ncbi:serpin family protein [bacterium]|nr:serpin family protein [bacterium]